LAYHVTITLQNYIFHVTLSIVDQKFAQKILMLIIIKKKKAKEEKILIQCNLWSVTLSNWNHSLFF